ncbi:hypothetical protein ACP70R_030480 [Stipagrostis hirtigluma subsp. patula]
MHDRRTSWCSCSSTDLPLPRSERHAWLLPLQRDMLSIVLLVALDRWPHPDRRLSATSAVLFFAFISASMPCAAWPREDRTTLPQGHPVVGAMMLTTAIYCLIIVMLYLKCALRGKPKYLEGAH